MQFSHRHWLILTVAISAGTWLLVGSETAAEICKWVDDEGVTHFAEVCPDEVAAETVTLDQGPSEEQLRAAEQRSLALQKSLTGAQTSTNNTEGIRSLPVESLGPLPEQNRSEYLQTTQAAILITGGDARTKTTRRGRFVLKLRATKDLSEDSVIEVHFPDPGNPAKTSVVTKTLNNKKATLHFESPRSGEFRCWNYVTRTFVYADDSRKKLLGVHEQAIQSHFDLPLLRDHPERIQGMARGGVCPSAIERDLERMPVDKLQALCETAREKRLAPERIHLVNNCVKNGKSRDYCERYFSSWGDAQRVSPIQVRPALYYDLPECLAWKQAMAEQR